MNTIRTAPASLMNPAFRSADISTLDAIIRQDAAWTVAREMLVAAWIGNDMDNVSAEAAGSAAEMIEFFDSLVI